VRLTSSGAKSSSYEPTISERLATRPPSAPTSNASAMPSDFGAPADGNLDTHIVHWWAETDVETKRATFDAIFERIEVGRDFLRFTFGYGFPLPFAVPFHSHKRSAASAPSGNSDLARRTHYARRGGTTNRGSPGGT
jgi:hypothetical protein